MLNFSACFLSFLIFASFKIDFLRFQTRRLVLNCLSRLLLILCLFGFFRLFLLLNLLRFFRLRFDLLLQDVLNICFFVSFGELVNLSLLFANLAS